MKAIICSLCRNLPSLMHPSTFQLPQTYHMPWHEVEKWPWPGPEEVTIFSAAAIWKASDLQSRIYSDRGYFWVYFRVISHQSTAWHIKRIWILFLLTKEGMHKAFTGKTSILFCLSEIISHMSRKENNLDDVSWRHLLRRHHSECGTPLASNTAW